MSIAHQITAEVTVFIVYYRIFYFKVLFKKVLLLVADKTAFIYSDMHLVGIFKLMFI